MVAFEKRELWTNSGSVYAAAARCYNKIRRPLDIVSKLALLLGIPILFNSLGTPIEEPFIGRDGTSLKNLTEVSRISCLGIGEISVCLFEFYGIVLNGHT